MSGDGEFISLAGSRPAAAAAAAAAAVTGMAVTGKPARDRPPKWAGNVLALPTLNIMKCLSHSLSLKTQQHTQKRRGGRGESEENGELLQDWTVQRGWRWWWRITW